jgi:hypothetical protein
LLGIFFGSDRSTEQSTENVVFIVPSVVEAVDGAAERSIREALDLYQGYDGDEEDLTAVSKLRRAPAVPPPNPSGSVR